MGTASMGMSSVALAPHMSTPPQKSKPSLLRAIAITAWYAARPITAVNARWNACDCAHAHPEPHQAASPLIQALQSLLRGKCFAWP